MKIFFLNDDEIKYICSQIPFKYAVAYFQQYPKKFNKIYPGYRAKSLNQSQVEKVLVKGSLAHDTFITDFLENHLGTWLKQIQEALDKRKSAGEEEYELSVLADSVFAENIALYYKLVQDKHAEEKTSALSRSVILIKKEREKFLALQSECDTVRAECETIKKERDKAQYALTELRSEVFSLREEKADDFKKFGSELDAKNKKCELLQKKLEQAQGDIAVTNQNLEFARNNEKNLLKKCEDLKTQIYDITSEFDDYKAEAEELSKNMEVVRQEVAATIQISDNLMRPDNMAEFAEFLGYNLEAFGVDIGRELLVSHIGKTIFAGDPLMIDQLYGRNLICCIANTFLGGRDYKTLTYKEGINETEIEGFLSEGSRIVCLENFLGNYNETLLIPLLQKHKGKIIFLTFIYDETISCLAEDFLSYARYINLSMFTGIKQDLVELEDPSELNEQEYFPDVIPDDRYSNMLRVIMQELAFPTKSINKRTLIVDGEDTFSEILAFEVLPYVMESRRINPFYKSEKLSRYIGANRFKYKALFEEWFS